jgi:hypothetical protein
MKVSAYLLSLHCYQDFKTFIPLMGKNDTLLLYLEHFTLNLDWE